MSIVKFSRVISCSSEDPKHPASNLLESQVGKCWKCKSAGEKQSVVILQLERNCRIHSIDIGNENSAFIEIFVGKSAVPDQYEIFRVASLLMSTAEAKKGENKNSVRFFTKDEFSKPAVNESWDRIKISCTQPFNKLVQYGLSFIKIRTKDTISSDATNEENATGSSPPGKFKLKDTNSVQSPMLGKFKLKQEPNDNNEVPIGSFFAKRNDVKVEPSNTAAAAIKAASKNPESASKRLSDLLPGFKDSKRPRHKDADVSLPDPAGRRSITGTLLYGQTHSDDEESSVPARLTRNSPAVKKQKTDNGPLIYIGPQSDEESDSNEPSRLTRNSPASKMIHNANTSGIPSTTNSRQKKSPQEDSNSKKVEHPKNVQQKPFNRLLEGVILVISGYQNPYRSELRNKALSMGAKYNADWNARCTHLICAFPNTPKANQVRGKGWIVRKEWIEDCYAQRKRLLSWNYKLDKSDKNTYGNDEEITELIIPEKKENMTSNTKMSSDGKKKKPTSKKDIEDVYNADTDVDSDSESVQNIQNYETLHLEVLPDFLSDMKFYMGSDVTEKLSNKLERYIIAFKGEVVSDIDNTDYIISEDSRYKDNVSNLPVLLPDWLWECNDQRQFVPIDDYLL